MKEEDNVQIVVYFYILQNHVYVMENRKWHHKEQSLLQPYLIIYKLFCGLTSWRFMDRRFTCSGMIAVVETLAN